ncbi:MAG: 2-oxoacid:acceptor oxidoreductase family protein [Candidatus Thorarchaeota archaeon]|jgi:indolepyruvate ferredoxin oxidoreductase beta subunit
MKEDYNILIAGVGGQGNLVCGKILSEAALRNDYRPVVGETFGASRRGGTVLTHLRISKRDRGPLIPKGRVDLLIGIEPLEALRAAIEYAGHQTIAVISTAIVETPGSLSDAVEYPPMEKIVESLRSICGEVIDLYPVESLENEGSLRLLNSYMLGAISVLDQVPLSKEEVRETVGRVLREPELNIAAFDAGAADALKLMS